MIRELIYSHPIPAGTIIAIVLIIAFSLDKIEWRRKSDADFLDMVNSSNPQRMMLGLSELRKRKYDISSYIHTVIPFLMADNAVDRVTAKMILKKHYPEDYLLIKGYEGSDDPDKCKKNLSRLHTKYGISS
jgi:hypothetical protein